MLTIENEQLRVRLLDPNADQARLGPRYCWGGYVWQVEDRSGRALLTGPEGPEERPAPFNGHGLPEAFRDRRRDGQELTWQNGRGISIGAGILERDAASQVQLVQPCRWTHRFTQDGIIFATQQEEAGHAYALRRHVRLAAGTLSSETQLTWNGESPLRTEWFAHPFFPVDLDAAAKVELPEGTTLAPTPGFRAEGSLIALVRRFRDQHDGQFALLQLPSGAPFRARITHQPSGEVRVSGDFAPSECPLWANAFTVSVEPYQRVHLEPGETRTWTLVYQFGTASSLL